MVAAISQNFCLGCQIVAATNYSTFQRNQEKFSNSINWWIMFYIIHLFQRKMTKKDPSCSCSSYVHCIISFIHAFTSSSKTSRGPSFPSRHWACFLLPALWVLCHRHAMIPMELLQVKDVLSLLCTVIFEPHIITESCTVIKHYC